jgi:N-acetylneuraminic acid mutarotase
MIVWGQAAPTGAGGIFDPVANAWTRRLSTVAGPGERVAPSVVWAASRMIVWGGWRYPYNDTYLSPIGGVYDPATDSWTETAAGGAPEGRLFHTAVSTGSRMIVWGGQTIRGDRYFDDGGIYDLMAGTWAALATSGAPSPRAGHAAVWTGSTMIVWGGTGDSSGGVYDPASNAWRPTSTFGAPSQRGWPAAVWTGSKMIVWGGTAADGSGIGSGAVYDPNSDRWTPMSQAGAPSPRVISAAVWTGTRMIVWGGGSSFRGRVLGDGGIYDPARDRWSELAAAGAPSPRMAHTAVWTGSRMVIFGGWVAEAKGGISATFNTGAIYDDPAVLDI